MRYYIYYMRPEFFRDGIMGAKPDLLDLNTTHLFLKAIDAEDLDDVYSQMQGERWSPNGEARELIRACGLAHTSMSVGDVAVDENGVAHKVASFGFDTLGNIDLPPQIVDGDPT